MDGCEPRSLSCGPRARQGFGGAACEQELHCANRCNGPSHGRCVGGRCECEPEWKGAGCAEPRCPLDCSQHGACLAPSVEGGRASCLCDGGWTGLGCDTWQPWCPNECSAHGACTDGRCVCEPGFVGADCAGVEGAAPSAAARWSQVARAASPLAPRPSTPPPGPCIHASRAPVAPRCLSASTLRLCLTAASAAGAPRHPALAPPHHLPPRAAAPPPTHATHATHALGGQALLDPTASTGAASTCDSVHCNAHGRCLCAARAPMLPQPRPAPPNPPRRLHTHAGGARGDGGSVNATLLCACYAGWGGAACDRYSRGPPNISSAEVQALVRKNENVRVP